MLALAITPVRPTRRAGWVGNDGRDAPVRLASGSPTGAASLVAFPGGTNTTGVATETSDTPGRLATAARVAARTAVPRSGVPAKTDEYSSPAKAIAKSSSTR